METPPDPYRESRQAARWGMGVSLALGGVKLLGGLFGNSLALLSDAVHSLVDAAVSVTLLLALYLALVATPLTRGTAEVRGVEAKHVGADEGAVGQR